MSRFTFVVVDDEAGNYGWARAFVHLKRLNLVRSVDQEPGGDELLHWITVNRVGPDGISPFEHGYRLIDEPPDNCIAIFLDVALTRTGFLPAQFLAAGREITFRRSGEATGANYPPETAGIPLFKRLVARNRPGILYTGISFDALDGERLGETERQLVEDISSDDFPMKIERFLDRELLDVQLKVVTRVTTPVRDLVLAALQHAQSDDDWARLGEIPLEVEGWTVGTLFPRQVIGQSPGLIRSLMQFDYKAFLAWVLNHPSNPPGGGPLWILGDARAACASAVAEDMQGGPVAAPIASVLRDILNRTAGDPSLLTQTLEGVYDELCTMQVFPPRDGVGARASAQAFLCGYGVGAVLLRSVSKYCGVSPIDLAYFVHVAEHNGITRLKGARPEVAIGNGWEIGLLSLTLSYPCQGLTREEWDERVTSATAKTTKEAIEKDMRTLSTGGLVDICRLVCGRYRGAFRFVTPRGSFSAWWSETDGDLGVTSSSEDAGDTCFYEITISKGGGR